MGGCSFASSVAVSMPVSETSRDPANSPNPVRDTRSSLYSPSSVAVSFGRRSLPRLSLPGRGEIAHRPKVAPSRRSSAINSSSAASVPRRCSAKATRRPRRPSPKTSSAGSARTPRGGGKGRRRAAARVPRQAPIPSIRSLKRSAPSSRSRGQPSRLRRSPPVGRGRLAEIGEGRQLQHAHIPGLAPIFAAGIVGGELFAVEVGGIAAVDGVAQALERVPAPGCCSGAGGNGKRRGAPRPPRPRSRSPAQAGDRSPPAAA